MHHHIVSSNASTIIVQFAALIFCLWLGLYILLGVLPWPSVQKWYVKTTKRLFGAVLELFHWIWIHCWKFIVGGAITLLIIWYINQP